MATHVVVVEIPAGSRNKYEMDHDTGEIFLDRRLFTATRYPTDYGFFPDTLAEDGDPLDALVLLSEPTFPGCRVRARPIAVFWMTDEKGPDAKVVCVPDADPAYARYATLTDLEVNLKDEIEHFFTIYKDLEPEKSTSNRGWGDAREAEREIAASKDRYGSGAGH